MIQISVSRRVNLSAEEVWPYLADFSGIARFHPFVETADQQSELNEGVGDSRRCNFDDGKSVVERVIEWQPGRRMKIELSEISMPIKRAVAEMSVAPRGDG
ncbi:MAG: SRPBCC family protein [Pseudomonadota bacterium]|nr:SRPBCC family protein [Pseudomonadota bacterium]